MLMDRGKKHEYVCRFDTSMFRYFQAITDLKFNSMFANKASYDSILALLVGLCVLQIE